MESLAKITHPPDLANQELEVDMEPLRSTSTVADPNHIDAEIHAFQGFAPAPQTVTYIKTELTLDEELLDNMNDSEANSKQGVLALADDHQARESTSDMKTKACQVCHSIYPTEYITTHMRLAHSKPRGIYKYRCELCSRAFKYLNSFMLHLKIHEKDRKREIACDVCGRTFYNNNGLCAHRRVHRRDTYYCKLCRRHFTQDEDLKMHMLRKHKMENSTPHTPNDVAAPPSARRYHKNKACAGGTQQPRPAIGNVGDREFLEAESFLSDTSKKRKTLTTVSLGFDTGSSEMFDLHEESNASNHSYTKSSPPSKENPDETFEEAVKIYLRSRIVEPQKTLNPLRYHGMLANMDRMLCNLPETVVDDLHIQFLNMIQNEIKKQTN